MLAKNGLRAWRPLKTKRLVLCSWGLAFCERESSQENCLCMIPLLQSMHVGRG